MTRAAAAWAVLALTGLALFGNYYVYDSIGPLAEQLSRELGYSDTQIGTLNAIYSVPNIVLVFVGGILVDRYGPGFVTFWSSLVCLAGAALTAIGTPFALMAAGRLMFGIAAQTMIVATIVALGIWFAGRQLAFAMALSISFARVGSYAVDVSPVWASGANASGWQAPLTLAAGNADQSTTKQGQQNRAYIKEESGLRPRHSSPPTAKGKNVRWRRYR